MTAHRVLVAGATGYLGAFVAKELKSRGHFVRALARDPRKLEGVKNELDEIVQGEVTRPDTISRVCDGVDVVFSSIGITKQKGKLSFKDVDYQGNKNLLEVALGTAVRKFVYISVFDGPRLRHLEIVKAHEDFVDALKASGLDYAVLRPTGFFSDLGEYFAMAKRGRAYLIGAGQHKVNPIHGADLARRCAEALGEERLEADVGGPEVLTARQIAELAFEALGRPARITSVPLWLARLAVRVVRPFDDHLAELMAFFVAMATRDVVAPPTGTHTLGSFFRELATGTG